MSFFMPNNNSSRPRARPSAASGPYSRSKSDTNVRSANAYTRTSPMFSWSKPTRGFGGSSGTSFYRRRPRDNFIARIWEKIKAALRDLYRYVRKHPYKAIVPIVMALVSSGALAAFANSLHLPIPDALMKAIGAGTSVKGGYDAWYGSQETHSPNGGLMEGLFKAASAFV